MNPKAQYVTKGVNADLGAMRQSLSQEKLHYTKFDPSKIKTPKQPTTHIKNYRELRNEEDRIES
jgi:hypothetical protein